MALLVNKHFRLEWDPEFPDSCFVSLAQGEAARGLRDPVGEFPPLTAHTGVCEKKHSSR